MHDNVQQQSPDKSLTQLQQDLADEILEVLDLLPPRSPDGDEDQIVELAEYEQIRAAIAQYTVEVCRTKGAIY